MGEELLRECREAVLRARRILEVGCGTGYLTALLRRLNPGATLVAVDLEPTLLARTQERLGRASGVHLVAADGEAFFGGPFDLIVSNSVFQWFSRPGDTLREYFQLLGPGGCLAFAALGPATFRELAQALAAAASVLALGEPPDIPARRFCSAEIWQNFLAAAGFLGVRVQRGLRTKTYPTVQAFLRALQATGATNPAPRPFSPRLYRRMAGAYREAFGVNGFIPVTYEAIWAVARK